MQKLLSALRDKGVLLPLLREFLLSMPVSVRYTPPAMTENGFSDSVPQSDGRDVHEKALLAEMLTTI